MTEDDRRALADLALRALDTIQDEYGTDAELCAASLVFEVRTADDDGEPVFHGNYKSLRRNSPQHIGGLHQATANWLLNP